MQLLEPTSQRAEEFTDLLRRSADDIAGRWLEALREDQTVSSVDNPREPLLLDAVPLVLDEILRALALDSNKIAHEKICRAARHGCVRAKEHFDVRELVREYQLLRAIIFRHVAGQTEAFAASGTANPLTVYLRVGAALDEAMREAINAFVQEHMTQLRRLSRTDSLTGLYNHRMFYERLEDELNRAKRYDGRLSVVLMDLDNFKAVNDLKGHQFGDRMLVKCAERLRANLRQTDILCRFGGDEFGLILTETSPEQAHAMMTRLSEDFTELGRKEGAPTSFGMTFGLSAHPDDDSTVRRIVMLADERLLRDKAKNKRSLMLAGEPERNRRPS